MNGYLWLNEFNQANIWEIIEQNGDRILCRLPAIDRESWFSRRDALGFWVWWCGQRRYIYERKGQRVQIEVKVNGHGKDLWVNAHETKPLTFEENLAFAAEAIERCIGFKVVSK